MKNLTEYLSSIADVGQRYVVTYFVDAGGGCVFNSVNNNGMEVQYYSYSELSQLGDLPVLEESDLSIVREYGQYGESNKIVIPEQVAQGLRFL